MKAISSLAGVILTPMLALVACGGTDPTTYEMEEFSVCFVDGGAWAGDKRAVRYVEEAYLDLERSFPDFLDDTERAARAASRQAPRDWSAAFEPLHIEAKVNIVRLGRLLPRMNRPLDLAPMRGQMAERQIWWPQGDHHTEYLGVALAEEFAEHQNLGEHIANFLSNFERVEGLLLDLGYADQGTGTAATSARELADTVQKLREDWEGVRPGMRRVIFDRPDMPAGESLAERLQARVSAICDSYSECDSERAECGSGRTSDGLTGEPMEGP